MLKNDIGNEKVFIFDSWSHKEDFLKRAFLLELAKKLKVENKEYKNLNNVGNKLTIEKVLTRKLVDKFVKPKIKYNLLTKTVSLIVLLAILITAIVKILEYLVVPYFNLNTIGYWLIEHKILIILLIFILFSVSWFALESVLNFYFLKKVDITESHTTKEDLEFSNYDYENYLKYILNKASLNKEEPFIIVFDNLDRVDDATVLNTLSLIQLTNEILEKGNFKSIIFYNSHR